MKQLMPKKAFRTKLEEELHSRLTLDHPLLLKLAKPEKNLPLLRLIALQGYQLTKEFAKYVAALTHFCPVLDLRQKLATNLYEEETGRLSHTTNHLKLMQQFLGGLGISSDDWSAAAPLPNTKDLIDYRWRLCNDPA